MDNNNPNASITVRKGEGDQAHNMRIFLAPNVDKNRIKDNIVFVNEPLDEAYRKCFDDAIREYNVGKKPSRQKWGNLEHPADGYLQKLREDIAKTADKRKRDKLPKPFYEIIVQVGNMEDYGVLSHPQRALVAKEILTKYMKEFQEKNPRLYVFCAVLHLDEGNSKKNGISGGTPHLHIDYFPVASNLPTGIPTRNALTKALEQQGIISGNSKTDNNNSVWQVQQIDILQKICAEHGVTTKVIGAEKRAYLSPDEYRTLMAKNEQLLARAREETDKSIKHIAFGKIIMDAEKLKEERAVADVLQEQYHDGLMALEQEKERLRSHYQDAESDLRAEASKAIQALTDAREQAENGDRQRRCEALIAQAEQMMAEAKSTANTAYKDAKAEVRKETELKIKEAELQGRRLEKMEMQERLANLQSRAINAETQRDTALHDTIIYKREIVRLQKELATEQDKAQKASERYLDLINSVRNNFSSVNKSAKVRKDCQKYFYGTELYDVVRWHHDYGNVQKTSNLDLQRSLQ